MRASFLLLLLTMMLPAAAQTTNSSVEHARAVVGYLNGELGKSRYKAMALHNEKCADTCSYSLTKTSFVEISVDRIRIVANIESSPNANDFSEDMKAATYLFSLVLWGNMPSSASYEDANRFLGDLLNKSSDRGAAIASTNNWTYGVVHIKCFGPSTMMVAVRTLSDVGETPSLCKQ